MRKLIVKGNVQLEFPVELLFLFQASPFRAGRRSGAQVYAEVGDVNEVRSLIEKVISDLYPAIDNLRYAIQRLEERA